MILTPDRDTFRNWISFHNKSELVGAKMPCKSHQLTGMQWVIIH